MKNKTLLSFLMISLVLGACGTEAPNIPTENIKTSSADGMQMVYVPAGDFLMGSSASDTDARDDEKPQHTIYLDAYWIDQTEVSNVMYQKCVQAGNCEPPLVDFIGMDNRKEPYFDNPQYGDYPVIQVTWYQAEAYCLWANKRLPSEAEWEKAARGTEGLVYPWGNTFSRSRINCCDTGSNEVKRSLLVFLWEYIVSVFNNDRYEFTSPVDEYANGASPYGALNMAGNAGEWVADWYGENYYSSMPANNPLNTTPSPYTKSGDKVVRGGGWDSKKISVRTTSRNYNLARNNFYSSSIGFRCAASQ